MQSTMMALLCAALFFHQFPSHYIMRSPGHDVVIGEHMFYSLVKAHLCRRVIAQRNVRICIIS